MKDYETSIMQEMDYDTFLRMIAKIPSCVYFKDTELKYRFSSHYWSQLNGHPIIGKTDAEIRVDQENVAQAEESDREIIRTKKGCKYEIKCETGGEISYLELNKEPVLDDEGNVLGIVGLINNITEKTVMNQKILEMSRIYENQCKELEASNEELTRSLHQIEEFHKAHKLFTTSMNHELRSPLNSIGGLLQLLMEDQSLNEEQRQNVTSAYQTSRYMLSIVNDLLEFAKFETDEFTIIPVEFELQELISGFEYINKIEAASKGLSFELVVCDGMPKHFCGDVIRIKQIITNFVNNAIKYTSEGGVVLKIDYRDGHMIISCIDTGQGIPDYAMDKLFSPYFRVNENINYRVQGTGLGLSIVKRIVERMKGELKVDSVLNKGTTFTAEIPLEVCSKSEEQLQENKDEDKDVRTVDFSKITALCVDDSKVSADILAALLKKNGINAEAVSNGEQAVEKANNQKYDIIFMDHLMPDMDGIEAFNIIRKQSRFNMDTPVVMLTGNAEADSEEFYSGQGLDGYLIKPVLIGRVATMINRLCAKKDE